MQRRGLMHFARQLDSRMQREARDDLATGETQWMWLGGCDTYALSPARLFGRLQPSMSTLLEVRDPYLCKRLKRTTVQFAGTDLEKGITAFLVVFKSVTCEPSRCGKSASYRIRLRNPVCWELAATLGAHCYFGRPTLNVKTCN